MILETHILEIKNEKINLDNKLLNIFTKDEILKKSLIEIKFEIVDFYFFLDKFKEEKDMSFINFYMSTFIEDFEVQKYINDRYKSKSLSSIKIELEEKIIKKNKNDKEKYTISQFLISILSGSCLINFNSIIEAIFPDISYLKTQLIFSDLIFLLFNMLGFFVMFISIYRLYSFISKYDVIENKNSKIISINNFLFIDNLFDNKNIFDEKIFLSILKNDEYKSYIINNYKKLLVEILYDKKELDYINSSLKINQESLNKFIIFLIENNLLNPKDYKHFSNYVIKYSKNNNLINFVKNEKEFNSNIFNKSLKEISLPH